MFRNTFALNIKSSRKEHFITVTAISFTCIALAFIFGLDLDAAPSDETNATPFNFFGKFILTLNTLLILIKHIQRLKDIGRPASHILFVLVPLYNIYFYFIIIFLGKSKTT